MKAITTFFFILFTVTSYAQKTKSDPLNLDSITAKSKNYIVAGSGGGFSGEIIQYYVLSNGSVYRSETLKKETSLYKKLSKKDTKSLFKKLKALHLEKIDFNHPGNMSHFIEEHKKGNVHSVKWGDSAMKVPEQVNSFYKFLMDKISSK